MKYDKENQEIARRLRKSYTLEETARILMMPIWVVEQILNQEPILSVSKKEEVEEVKKELFKKYKVSRLSTKQAFDAIGIFKRGRELGRELNTNRLPTLSIYHVARYIVLYTPSKKDQR